MILRTRLHAIRLGDFDMCGIADLGEFRADLSLEENFRGLVVKQSKGANEEEERNGYEEGS